MSNDTYPTYFSDRNYTFFLFSNYYYRPVEIEERLVTSWSPEMEIPYFRTYALPVKIEDNVWIGGGVTIDLVLP